MAEKARNNIITEA
ncbi:hypothetical protein AYI70_g8674, partial [Smittium culicis]